MTTHEFDLTQRQSTDVQEAAWAAQDALYDAQRRQLVCQRLGMARSIAHAIRETRLADEAYRAATRNLANFRNNR